MKKQRLVKDWRELRNYAREIGITDAAIETGGKHPKIVGTVKGKPISVVFAGSRSDRMGLKKARCDIRRAIKQAEAT